ncbi:hypothetical protein AK971_01665 [Brucella abortus]|nr:hypothetical protein AK971_01665 [Brucella abortus]
MLPAKKLAICRVRLVMVLFPVKHMPCCFVQQRTEIKYLLRDSIKLRRPVNKRMLAWANWVT